MGDTTDIFNSPWRKAYWFSRMLINNDKYGSVGKDSQIMLTLATAIRLVLDDPHITSAEGKVKKITDFGAFVEITPGTDGLVHISELAKERVGKVSDIVKEGDEIEVKVLEVDGRGRIRLSRKVLL